ncbi:uncharacterized protein HMPREF1541_00807 [Cyphellophora europaea CBS 101466]|uniref:Clr5 domain-containing protein n=1 Tax=Cyphellophora europaea (strain CBS 101466) TaxID=1220924 RepID=W2SD15_CYPE1|nr:uncharacterized protein HMPREF1541_00807 [Cyphellophora europaea CBS 101466]ETN46621.1 hypothetical protein HMPREF1541_00807 [Cyphellophora europaea CBS 101466]
MDMNYQTGNMDLDFVSSPFSAAPSPFDTSAVKDMDIQSLNLYPPLDPPSREDWERFKPVILEQYVGLNLTVKELVHHMEMWYQFKATPRMFKQRFTEWNVFKYAAAARRRQHNSSTSFTSAPVQLSASPTTDVASTAMSRVSSATSYASSSFSNPFPDEAEQYTGNWGCIQGGTCSQAAVCAHRHCIQTFLANLEQYNQVPQTSQPPQLSSPYGQPAVPRRGSVEKVLYYVEQFSDSWMSPDANTHLPCIPDAADQAKRITSGISNHCSHKSSPKQCERCTWAEFDFGLAMLEDGHADLAVTSFELGCRLAHLLLSQPSKLFIRNLVMAFGSSRWEKFESFRHKLLEYLALMAQVVLGDNHPITIILQNVAYGDTLVAASEFALRTMIRTFEKTTRAAHPDVLLVKRSLSVILRREQQFQVGEELLLSAIHDSETENGEDHKETRRCLRRLGHLYMQQQRWDEAEAVFMRILDSAPGKQEYAENWVPDEISVYTYQHLARMASDMGDRTKCRYWFSRELVAAIKRWGPQADYATECLQLAYNETPPDSLHYVVEQYPEILLTAQSLQLQGNVIVSKARWCAVRNLI